MAALGFFRRNQKMVFLIMVFLMLVFLLTLSGSQTLINLFSPKAEKVAVGKVGGTEILRRDMNEAEQDLHILRDYLMIGNVFRILAMPPGLEPIAGEQGFFMLNQLPQNDSPKLTWTLLLQEARKMGMHASGAAVDDFLARLGIDSTNIDNVLMNMQREGYNEKQLRRAVENYILVSQAFSSVADRVATSEPELRAMYRDENEKLSVAMVEFPASDFVSKVAEPSEPQIAQQFDDFKAYPAGSASSPSPFKFGYSQPKRVQVESILVRYNDIVPLVQPDEDEMIRYWNAHRGELMKEVPAPTTSPSTQPAQMVQVPITEYSEAKPKIREILSSQSAQRKLDEILSRLTTTIRQAGEKPDAMETAAKSLLESGVRVEHRYTSPMTEAQLQGDPILGAAYSGTGEQAQSLPEIAFSIAEFHQGEKKAAALTRTGQLFNQPMEVRGEQSDKLLWRVATADAGGVPKEMTPTIREQVVKDLKDKAAYDMAAAKAREIVAAAQKQGLAAAATAAGKTVSQTEPLPRKVLTNNLSPNTLPGQIRILAAGVYKWYISRQQGERPQGLGVPVRLYYQAAMIPPLSVSAPQVPSVRADQTDDFMQQVFSLVNAQYMAEQTAPRPQGSEATTPSPTSAPATAESVKVVELPVQGSAYAVQRVKFEPAYEGGFEKQRLSYIGAITLMQRYELLTQWFSQPNIISRTGYQGQEGE